MSPIRRDVLAGTALLTTGLLAGCVTGSDGPAGGTETPPPQTEGQTGGATDEPLTDGGGNDSSGTRPEGSGGPVVALVGTDPAPDLPVEPAVEVDESEGTGDSPPTLHVSLTNTSDTAVVVGEARAVLFEYVTDESGSLQLLPADEEYPVDGEDCLRLSEGVAVTEEYRTEEIGPGETIEADVKLYALPEYDGCVPVGEFRFVTTYSVGESVDALDQKGEWGFTVALD